MKASKETGLANVYRVEKMDYDGSKKSFYDIDILLTSNKENELAMKTLAKKSQDKDYLCCFK